MDYYKLNIMKVLLLQTPSGKQGMKNSDGAIVNTEKGFSLMELIITIAIMGIVMGIATLSFNTWQVKNKIEAQTHEMFADISEARTNAFTQKKYYGLVFQPTSYVMKSYSSEVEIKNVAAQIANGAVVASKSLSYGITKKGLDITDTPIIFDTSGFTNSATGLTIFVNPTSAAAAVNCLVLSAARTNIGKVNGSACEFK